MSRQRLGQHFLFKGSVLERIANAACPVPEPFVIEIGPGKGALTQKLLERTDRLMLVEIDPDLIPQLRGRFPDAEVVLADARDFDFAAQGKAVITGNLPYYAATPIMQRVWRGRLADRAVFLIQKEVAERLAAPAGTRDFGYLSVDAQFHARITKLFDVPPSAFHPPPKVFSTVVKIEPIDRADELKISDSEAFLRFVSVCFQHKRKTLRNNLSAAYPRDAVDRIEQASRRAEELTLNEFAEIYHRLVG